jgi:hypothetical protein
VPQDFHATYHDQVIEAAFLHSKLGCYFIGPFARRVSFASQQLRALDLIDALEARGKLPDNGPVAVIGAGLSGVTAAAALLGRRCKVDLYEYHPEVLTRQRGATHRLVHPTISRWPMEDLSLTTSLPFYDWGVGNCSRIMSNLAAEWRRYFDPETRGSSGLRLFTDRRVLRLASPATGGRPRVALETDPVGAGERAYELVIVTTGYGAEHGLGEGPATSYWDPDELESRRQGDSQFAIGGCGDGGLIDALRLVHDHFHAGWLAFAIAERLDALGDMGGIRPTILEAEHDAMMMWKSIACASQKPTDVAPLHHEILDPLYAAYERVVDLLPESILGLLDESIVTRLEKVWLIAPEARPTIPLAAPIHKLMIVQAIRRGAVAWKPGMLRKTGDAYRYRPPNGAAVRLHNRQVIERRGAASGLTDLIDAPELVSLKLRQFMLADRIDVSLKRRASPPLDYPPVMLNDVISPEFISSRYPAAAALVEAVDPRHAVDADRRGFRYVRLRPDEPPVAGSGSSLGVGLPRILFDAIEAREGDSMSRYDALV